MLCSDGWKEEAVGQGAPLVNFVVLKPGGGVHFAGVVNTTSEKKDAATIAETHIKWAEQLTGGDMKKLLGIIMDNTKANRNAMVILEELQPYWLLLGCVAHGLNVLCKDLANKVPTSPGC